MGKCHICGAEADYECRDCGELVCDNCTMPYNQFTQIDYTLCKSCGGVNEEARANEHHAIQLHEEQELKEKQVRNENQRKYYHSEKAVEKRRLKRIELQKLRAKQKEESIDRLTEVFINVFKHF